MLESIISALNTRLLQTDYFKETYGLSKLVKPNEVTYPALYCGKGEYKHVTNFDELNGSCYWRKIGSTTSTDIDSTSMVSSKKMVRLTFPLRLVAVVSRDKMTIDNPYNAETLARSIFAVINKNLNGNIRQLVGARAIYLNLVSIDDDSKQIYEQEFNGNNIQVNFNDKLVSCALNLSIGVDIRQDCIVGECDELTECEAVLIGLSTQLKNTCILPTYDFADTNVTDNLTAQQESDLTDLLCGAGCSGDINVYINGSLNQTVATADYSTETINIYP